MKKVLRIISIILGLVLIGMIGWHLKPDMIIINIKIITR